MTISVLYLKHLNFEAFFFPKMIVLYISFSKFCKGGVLHIRTSAGARPELHLLSAFPVSTLMP